MKVHSISSLAVALAAATLSPGMAAQDACSGGCSSTQAASAPRDAVAVLTAPFAQAFPAAVTTADDPPRLGVAVDITDNGIRVDEVIEGSLAESAGVQSGDLIFRLNGTSIIGPEDIASILSEIPPGGEVNVTVIRDGEGLVGLTTTTAKPEPKPAPRASGGGAGRSSDAPADFFSGGFLGVTLGADNDLGVAVVSIVEDSSAWYAGIDGGDIIISIDGESVSDPDDVVGAISSRAYGSFVDIEVVREGSRQTMRARLGRRGPSGGGPFGRLFDGGESMGWIQPNDDANFLFPKGFFGDGDGPDNLRGNLPQFELGSGNVFEWKSDGGDGEAKFFFKGGDGDFEFDGDTKALIEKARKDGAKIFEFKTDNGEDISSLLNNSKSKLKGMLKKGGKSGWIIENDDGMKIDAIIESAMEDGKVLKLKGGASGKQNVFRLGKDGFNIDAVIEGAAGGKVLRLGKDGIDVDGIIKGAAGGKVLRLGKDGIDIDTIIEGAAGGKVLRLGKDGFDIDAIIEGAAGGKVLRLGKDGIDIDAIIEGAAGGKILKLGKDGDSAIKMLRKGADSSGGKSSSMKIMINGDKVTVDRDGKVEEMTLDELSDIEGLNLHMHDGSSIFEWADKLGDDAKAEVHVEVHKSHEHSDHDEHEHGDV